MTRPATGTRRGLALLPALRIEDETDLDNAATTLRFRAGGYGRAVARTVAGAVAIFGDNALTHGSASEVGVVTTVAFDPDASALQVVSTDLGPHIVEPKEAERYLLSVRQHAIAAHSNFAHLVEAGTRRGLSVVLTLASSSGRVRWSPDGVSSITTEFVPGFTQALTISVR